MASAKAGGGAPNGPPNGGAADAATTSPAGEPAPRPTRRAARRAKPEGVQGRPNRSREPRTQTSIRPSRARSRSTEKDGEAPNTVRNTERPVQGERAGGPERRPPAPERPTADPRAIPESV